MVKAREVRLTAITFVKQLVSAISPNRNEVYEWSASKRKFVDADNHVVSDAQVRKYLEEHPDEETALRASIHHGYAIPRPAVMLPETSASAQVDIDQLIARIDDYQAGFDRSAQSVLDQTQKVLDRLGLVEQTLAALQQGLTQTNQDVSANFDQIKEAIRQVETHYQDLSSRFGQTEQQLADAVAFDRDFSQKLDNLQQQLEDLQGLREEITRLQSGGVFNQTLLAVDQPGIGEVVFLTFVALLVGIAVTMFALRSEGRWLDIPDIVWGIVAVIATFLIFFIASWTTAEREEQIRVRGVS